MDQLDIKKKAWMKNYLKMNNGLIEFTIPKTGKYEIIQQSRSSNMYHGPAMGVYIEFELNLKQVRYI